MLAYWSSGAKQREGLTCTILQHPPTLPTNPQRQFYAFFSSHKMSNMPFLCLTEAYLIILLYHMFAALQKPNSVSNVGSETELIHSDKTTP